MAPTKLVAITPRETSGVDHPAHLREGWVVMKQAGAAEGPRSVPGRLIRKETVVPPVDTTALTQERDQLAAQVAELQKALDVATGKVQPPSEDEILKSVPEPVRQMLEKARTERAEAIAKAEAAEAEITKAREEKLDAEATAAAEVYKSLGVKPDEVGPALRRLDATDAALAKAVRTALDAAKERATTEHLFKSVGTSVVDNTAGAAAGSTYGQIVELAKAKVAAGVVKTVEAGVAQVAVERPDLYRQHLSEKGVR